VAFGYGRRWGCVGGDSGGRARLKNKALGCGRCPPLGALVVLGPLAADALTAAEGAAAGGGLRAVLGHFIAKKHVPKYSRHFQAGNYLVLRHQPQASDAEKLQQDTTSPEVEHHEDLLPATATGTH
jgi:hypothetical protein